MYNSLTFKRFVNEFLFEDDHMSEVYFDKILPWLNDFARRCGFKHIVTANGGWNCQSFSKGENDNRFFWRFDIQLENGTVIEYNIGYDRPSEQFFNFIVISGRVFLIKKRAIEYVLSIRDE